MRRTKEDAEKTRKAILASAMDIFCEKGYSKTTFDEIAKRICLTKGAVYWYFRNKPDIVAALINDFAAKHFDLVEQYINAPEKMDFDDIINVELLINKQIREDSEFAKFLFFVSCQMEWSETIISKVHPAIEQTKNVGHNLLLKALQGLQKRGKIRPEVDVAIITEILRMMYSGMLEGFFSKRLEHDFDDVVKTGFNLVFNSIKTQGNSDEN
ncbi:MAG: TetR/AcrR family transcriptional regulator [Alphaproteobacteria bacterium]|nr:TetR/AcrR family transcriptional regulator [Alphaproteobacteria bacterium]